MTGYNSTRTQSSQRSRPAKRMTMPGWAIILLTSILSIATISFLWYKGQKSVVEPYYEFRRKSISLCPFVQNVQVQVEYPRRISQDDRGVQHHKRLVVGVTKTEAGPPEVINLAVKPMSGHIHFLAENGSDISGQLTVTATHGITEVRTLYIEHPNVPQGGPISLSLELLPPTGVITQPVLVEKSDFVIEEESFVARTVRGVVSLWPWQSFLLAFLAIPVPVLKTFWDHHKRMANLYERMKQAWDERKIDDIRNIYGEYQGLVLLPIPIWRHCTVSIPGHRGIESLHRQAANSDQARFYFELAAEASRREATLQAAEEYLEKALDWDPAYEKVRPLYEQAQSLEEEHRRPGTPAARWWIEPRPGSRVRQELIDALEDREHTHAEVRRRIVNVLGHIQDYEAGRAIERVWREDEDWSVRAQAAWMLIRRPRPERAEQRKLNRARPAEVEEWLQALPLSLDYNPFEVITAEADPFLDRHFFEHPSYRQLIGPFSVALFADQGNGKTSSRLMLQRHYRTEEPRYLVIDYTDFGALVAHPEEISAETHIRTILHKACTLLGIEPEALTPSIEQLKGLLKWIRLQGYQAMCVLVDNVSAYAETQANLRTAEMLIRHLVGNYDLVGVPCLHFKLFLPMALKERLLGYGGMATGRIKFVDMEWTPDLLHELLAWRLKRASSKWRRQVTSLRGLVMADPLKPFSTLGPLDIDKELVRQAQGSPRRLIYWINRLFQHRARLWHESGKDPGELFITRTDWAILLEHLLKQGDVIV